MGEEFSFDDGMDEGIDVSLSMCSDCAINPATVHLTHIDKNEVETFHLCEECARNRGVPIPDGETLIKGLEAMIGNAAATLAAQQLKLAAKPIPPPTAPPAEERKAEPETIVECSDCGMKLTEFSAGNRFGCAGCYAAFEEPVEKLMLQIHGFGEHRGKKYGKKRPRGCSGELERLQRELDEAVKEERFEQAAVIRDAIRGMKQGKR